MLRVFWYIDMLMCVVHALTRPIGMGALIVLVSADIFIDKDRYVNAQTHGMNKFSIGAVAAPCQRACVNQKQPMG